MNSDEFRKAAHASIEEIIKYYETVQDRRVVSDVSPGYLRELLPSGPPVEGEKWEDIQKDIESKIMPGLTHWQSPRFMAWYPASSTYPGMLGELFSAAFTAAAFNWICSPAVTELETIVLDWVAKLLHLPECFLSHGEGGGVIQGTASEAVVVALVAARERYLDRACKGLEGEAREQRKAEVRSRMVALATDQTHSSTQKGAIIAGVRFRAARCHLRDDMALTGDGLREVLEDCRNEGLEPFYLTTTLGTTATCATDRFEEIADVLRSWPNIWVHVDAAYAGAALVCEEYQHLTKTFEAFDSFDMNMHKWLLTNFDASCFFVKRRRDLTDAMSITPAYLRHDYSDAGLVTDYRDWQIPLGRRFRSLKIWFVLRTYGVSGLKAHIRRTIKLGELFHSLLLSRSDFFTVVTPPAFALTVFVVSATNIGNEAPNYPAHKIHALNDHAKSGNALNGNAEQSWSMNGTPKSTGDPKPPDQNTVTREVYESINASGQFFMTSGVVEGVYAIRVVSANPLSDEAYVRKAFETLVTHSERILDKYKISYKKAVASSMENPS